MFSAATQGWVTGLAKQLLRGSQNGLDWAQDFVYAIGPSLRSGDTPFPAYLKEEAVLLLQLEKRLPIQEVELVCFC
jgi:hypothetical protein